MSTEPRSEASEPPPVPAVNGRGIRLEWPCAAVPRPGGSGAADLEAANSGYSAGS